MSRARRRMLFAIMATALLGSAEVAGQSSARINEVPIRIEWNENGRPSRVLFEGGSDFVPHANFYEGRRARRGEWALHNIAVTYGAYEVPLTAITRPEQPFIRFRVYNARYASCEPADVDAVYAASLSGTVNARIADMMRARKLLELTGEACPAAERLKMAKMYFRLSCALARDPNSGLAMSREARDRYHRLALTDGERREANSCLGLAEARAITALQTRLAAAQREGAVEEAARLTQELLAHADDADWANGFAVLQIDSNHIRSGQIRGLYERQIELGVEGEMEEALEVNQALIDLHSRDDYQQAFTNVRLTQERLLADRETYMNRMPEQ